MPKPLLDDRKRFVVVAAFGVEEPVGRKTRLGECRSEQVAPLDHPQHYSLQPGGNSGREQCRGCIVAGRTRGAPDLVQRRDRKAAAELSIHCVHPERQPLGCAHRSRGLNGPDLRSKRLQRMNGMALHSDSDDSFVHFMFPS